MIGNKLLLVLRLPFFDEGLRALALIAIGHRQRNADANGVSAGAGGNLIDATSQREIRDALSILQTDGRVGGALTELCGLQIRSSSQRFVAHLGKRELIRLRIKCAGDIYVHSSIISTQRDSQVAHGNLVIPFRIRYVGVELEFFDLEPRKVEAGNLASLDQLGRVLDGFGKSLLVFLCEVE